MQNIIGIALKKNGPRANEIRVTRVPYHYFFHYLRMLMGSESFIYIRKYPIDFEECLLDKACSRDH